MMSIFQMNKRRSKKKLLKNLKIKLWITLFIGITFSYFLWISWQKLTDWIGNSTIVWAITGGIVLLAIILGYFSFDKIAKKFK